MRCSHIDVTRLTSPLASFPLYLGRRVCAMLHVKPG